MFSKTKYFFLSLAVLTAFSSSTYAEGDTYCAGRVTGVTNLQNPNAGQISFNSHLGPGIEDDEAVDLSIIGQASGLAPANREHAACVNDEIGTYGPDAYEYGLHGFSWNDNLGFISYGCQDGKNRAGEGRGVDCGNIDYGVYIDAANELFGHAWSSAFGWMQFRGQGETAAADGGAGGSGADTKILNYTVQNAFPPAPQQTGSNTISGGETIVVNFQGQEYQVTLNGTWNFAAVQAASVTINGSSYLIPEGDTQNLGSATFIAENITAGVVSPLLGTITFRLREFPLPVGEIKGPYNIDIGEAQAVTVDGVSYEVNLQSISADDVSTVSIDGSVQNVNKIETKLFSSLNFTANTVITIPGNAYGPLNVNAGGATTTTITVDGLSTNFRVELLENTPFGSSRVRIINQNTGINLGTQWVNEGATGDFDQISLLAWESNSQEFAPPPSHLIYYLIPNGGAFVDGAGCADGLCGAGGEVFDYGVTMDADGYLHGYAWTEAGIWVDFEGAQIYLPDLDDDGDSGGDGANWCKGKFYICVEVRPNPGTLEFDAGGDKEIRIADGTDGYYVHLFLMDGTGDNPLVSYNPYSRIAALPNDQRPLAFTLIELVIPPPAVINFLNSIQVNWQDTVKINQTNGAAGDAGDTLSTVEGFNSAIVKQPWATKNGAITYKPLTFADFDPVSGEPGHYISKFKTSSFAPTDDGNLSWTTSTDPAYLVNNTEGRYEVEPNQLILESVTYDALSSGALQLKAGETHPNGKANLHLPFRPAIEVNTLYSGVLRDTLQAYRSVSENVAIGVRSIGALPAYALNSAKVAFILDYSKSETQAELNCDGANFDFHFLKSLTGVDWTNANPSKKSMVGTFISLNNVLKDIPVLATLPPVAGEDPAVALPCNYAKAPTLYSKIQYKPVANYPTVSYYHNGLPRIAGSGVFNPQIVVEGKIVSQKITGVTSLDNLQSSGSGVVSAVREIINKNIKQQIGDFELSSGQECTVSMLNTIDNYTVAGCTPNEDYKILQIGDENVLYFSENDVVLDLDGGFDNQWVIIAYGDIFVHGDAYNPEPDEQRLSLLAFQNEDFEHGNVYLGPCSDPDPDNDKMVKNLQATIVADGGLYSYTGNKEKIEADGRSDWESPAARVDALGCQLLLEGAIYAPGNTIGGADADSGTDPRPFILLGGGEVIELPASLDDRKKAQNDDLNYLRLFRLELEISPEGLPIDQRCGMGISPADTLAIIQSQLGDGPVVCGEPLSDGTQPCDPETSDIFDLNVCDGIDPFNKWQGGNSPQPGDLVPPQDEALLADRLDNGSDFDPVYVFYVAPDSDSFVFSEAGGF